tara:strand:+ start:52 stop:432 length:381 start_codon:yes stop_codon:yes gene_type:complete
MIKDINIEELRVYAGSILAKTYFQLGQNPDDEYVFAQSLTLAEDLRKDFYNMKIEDVQEAFRIGLRETEIFHITVKTYYKWIKDHRQIIWNNETIPESQQDMRLNYRSRNGTGIKRIDINKIKLLK